MFAALALASGCSSFEREWRRLETEPLRSGAHPIEGRWEGTWRSDASGHSGGLRAIVLRTEDPGEFEVRYHATWGCCFWYTYTLHMRARREADRWRFTGEAELGWFGLYRYEGEADWGSFRSYYRSGSDHGVFELAPRASGLGL
jgi:hypothetical protein